MLKRRPEQQNRNGGFFGSLEILLIIVICVLLFQAFGTLRDTLNAELHDTAEAIGEWDQSYCYDGIYNSQNDAWVDAICWGDASDRNAGDDAGWGFTESGQEGPGAFPTPAPVPTPTPTPTPDPAPNQDPDAGCDDTDTNCGDAGPLPDEFSDPDFEYDPLTYVWVGDPPPVDPLAMTSTNCVYAGTLASSGGSYDKTLAEGYLNQFNFNNDSRVTYCHMGNGNRTPSAMTSSSSACNGHSNASPGHENNLFGSGTCADNHPLYGPLP